MRKLHRPVMLVATALAVAACAPKTPEPAVAPPVLSDVGADSRPFTVVSADGTQITGQVDRPFGADGDEPVIVMSAGTGLFDRDERLSNSGTERDAIFADLSRRFTQAGIATVRYDRRGVRYKPADGNVLDKAVSGTSTVESQRDDLGAVYDLAREEFGGTGACVALLGHSEGMQHISGLAAAGAPAPALVLGIGAPLQAPVEVVKWQGAGRDAFSLRMLDADGDGTTTNDEVRAGLMNTPSGVYGKLQPFLHPLGEWTPGAISLLITSQEAQYEVGKAQALAMDPAAPFPDEKTPMAQYSWWQNWYTDDVPVAEKLAAWDVPFLLYYGTKDSQVRYEFQQPVAEEAFGPRLELHVLSGLGHSLGDDVLTGPMNEAVADTLVTRATAILKERCGP